MSSYFKKLRKERQRIEKLKDQQPPRKLLELFNPVTKRTRKKSDPSLLQVTINQDIGDESGASKPLKLKSTTIKRGNYESDERFIARLSKMCYQAKSDAEMEKKYGVEIDPSTGDLMPMEPTMTERKLKRKLKLKERQKAKKARQKRGQKPKNEFAHLKDVIKFGEVVSRPPDLSKFKNVYIKYKNKS